MQIKISRLSSSILLPSPATDGSVGYDLRWQEPGAFGTTPPPVHLRNKLVHIFPTGLKIALPRGVAMLILPRSGLASQGITVANSPGLIDPDYRGEIKVALRNHTNMDREIHHGDRIAQAIFIPYFSPQLEEVAEEALLSTLRGEGGFGSTGTGEQP